MVKSELNFGYVNDFYKNVQMDGPFTEIFICVPYQFWVRFVTLVFDLQKWCYIEYQTLWEKFNIAPNITLLDIEKGLSMLFVNSIRKTSVHSVYFFSKNKKKFCIFLIEWKPKIFKCTDNWVCRLFGNLKLF